MKSLKFIFAAVVVAIATTAMAGADSILYWMVDSPFNTYKDEYSDFTYVKVLAVDRNEPEGASYLNVWDPNKSDTHVQRAYDLPSAGYSTGGIYSGVFDGDTVDYFLVELYDASNSRVAWQSVSYLTALNNGSISSPLAAGGATVYTITQVVPEPTSGILLLLGFAGLALRRKKA